MSMIYDCHMHTVNSDGKSTVDQMCESAIEKGVRGIAITDHAELIDYMRLYFDLLSETVDAFDFDILAHIACPVRYMTTRHGRYIDVKRFEPKIKEILKKVIDRGIALELQLRSDSLFLLFITLSTVFGFVSIFLPFFTGLVQAGGLLSLRVCDKMYENGGGLWKLSESFWKKP